MGQLPGAEATARGAIGVIFTYGPDTAPYYSVAPDALGSFDAEFDWADVPAVYIAQQDGAWLEGQLDSPTAVGPVVTMKLIENVRLAIQGGTGYNVFADLPGKVKDGTFVLFGAHHDAHFHAATDDTDACVNNLAIAKAMVMSGYRPQHTVRFMFTTGEEFGYTNSYYDWCIGAWWAITHAHPDWAGKIRAFLNSDYFVGDNPLQDHEPRLHAAGQRRAAAASSLLPYGYKSARSRAPGRTAGRSRPPACRSSPSTPRSTPHGTYHTQYMRESAIDWHYMADISKFIFRVEKPFNNGGLLPYGLRSRADNLADTVVPADLLDAGADPGAVSRLQNDVTAFQGAASAYEARAGSIPAAHFAADNASLLKIEKHVSRALTGLSPFESTVYPHEQVLLDVQSLNEAIADLQAQPADADDALSALANVD